ncbi:class I SAM-dependent methyltransferase [Jiella avicenniae]|uniref:Class I SAM-dependent methyltransferase n=1 Tax=Jiella avicenniae TaxID=2907202 RepID=A0A9X1P2L0_9HYPH|nr:class I SAM-dependent methyltransferase [Jiella avicenniae]MCE7030232.1 class I SAM-dependent methyltransferase [Jiella avicenniae]
MTIANAEAGSWVKPDPMSNPRSIERRFRANRFRHVRQLLEAALAERDRVEVLDLGGTEAYWAIAEDFLAEHRGRIGITLVNNEPIPEPKNAALSAVSGDACDAGLFAGRRFDLVHSNSVIEHVGEVDRMQAFADNVRRLSDRYFVQTPNFWFPLEPHFRVLGFQWLPLSLRVALMQRRNLGFFPRAESHEEAWRNVAEIRLLDRRLMRRLFPEADLRDERVAGLTKSLMAVRDRT